MHRRDLPRGTRSHGAGLLLATAAVLACTACSDARSADPMDGGTNEATTDAGDVGMGDDTGADAPDDALAGEEPDANDAEAGDAAAEGSPIPEFVDAWGGYGTEPGQFIEPSSVAMGPQGHVYVAGHEDRFQTFTKDGELLDIHGEPGDGPGQFDHPHGLVVDDDGEPLVYVGDQENHRLQVFEPDGTFVRKIGSDLIEHIHDIGVAPGSGDVYVGDLEQHVVRRFSPTGELLATHGGPGTEPGQFDGVWGVATDAAGNLYVADTGNGRIQKLGPDGTFLGQWSDFRGSPFAEPTGVLVGPDGLVYVCDAEREAILLFDREGHPIQRWDLASMTGLDTEPEDVAVGDGGTHVYVAEVGGHRVLHLERP